MSSSVLMLLWQISDIEMPGNNPMLLMLLILVALIVLVPLVLLLMYKVSKKGGKE